MTLIQTRALTRDYRLGRGILVQALRGVDLGVKRGAFCVILGRSGSGKSTLLNLIGGLDRPTSGSLVVDGKDLGTLSGRQLAAYRAETVGFVFQSFHLQPRFLAWENVALPLVFQGVDRRVRKRRASALLDRVGLGHRGTHRPTELSGGEQQRVALARSLVTEPRLLLCDEPTGNLDTHTAGQILELVAEANGAGMTVALVTHDREIANEHASQVVDMDDGKIASVTVSEDVS